MKKILAAALSAVLLLTACGGGINFSKYQKFSREFDGTFDIHTTIIGYAESKTEFENYCHIIYNKIFYLHQLFDIYNDYEGVNNLKTINDSAGLKPVKVDDDIIELLELSLVAPGFNEGGRVNVAFGSVLKIWHEYRMEGGKDPANAKLPRMDELLKAAKHTDLADVVIDETEGTVFLKDSEMSLDVGSVAKGYAAQKAMETAVASGAQSIMINMGGNVVTHGRPMEKDKERWAIGIQDPKPGTDDVISIMDTIFVNDAVIVTSGNYQRFYTVDGVRYNHIIDPETLMPAQKYAAVTIVCDDSAIADLLSTQLFITGKDSAAAERLIKEAGAEILYVNHDGTVEATDGFVKISKNLSGYSAKD